MLFNAISTLAGAYALELCPQLPPLPLLAGCLAAAAMLFHVAARHAFPAFLTGFAVMGMAAHTQLSDRLDASRQGETITLVGKIDEFPQIDGESMRLIVRPGDRADLPERIRLTWIKPGVIPRLGESWYLSVRLREPRGYANPGGFDYEGWLFRQGIGATGYVLADSHNYRLQGEKVPLVDRLRGHVVERIASLADDEAASVLMAIAVGARHTITRKQWQLYAATGTSHLMAISGLHIGLAASSAYLCSWWLLASFFRRRNLRLAAAAGAILAATLYAVISGFAVPARRALIMALLVAAAVFLRRRANPAHVLSITALLVFLADPLAILAPGFKLSFAAVAVLFFVARFHVAVAHAARQRLVVSIAANVLRLGWMQIALLAGLFPLTVLLFGRFSLVAPVVNLLILPVFNVLTVPLALAGVILDGPLRNAGDQLLVLAHKSIRLVLWIATTGTEPGFASLRTAEIGALVVPFLSMLYVMLPPGWPGRRIALLGIVSVLSHRPTPPADNCVAFHALDVGQGQAIVVQTKTHALLFDTGPSFQNSGNSAELVIIPFLVHRGIRRLERVIVSHADLDHSGGAASIVAEATVGSVLVGERLEELGHAQVLCIAGQEWRWDGVRFRVLHPRRNYRWAGNNSSCVLEIDTGTQKLLLPGDIELPVEKLLLHQRAFDRTEVVFVPHHGSRTSSSQALVDMLRPRIAIVSAGYDNRWGFPKEGVIERWRRAGAVVLNTATSGAISQTLCRGERAAVFQEARSGAAKYWNYKVPERP